MSKNKITRKLSLEKEGDSFVSVVEKTFDMEDYYTIDVQRMRVKNKEFVETNLASIKGDIDKKSDDIKKNVDFLAKIEKEFRPHWDSKEFSSFMKNYDKKYSKLIKWKTKYDEFMNKSATNEQFKADVKVQEEFKEHYEEMLEKWEAK